MKIFKNKSAIVTHPITMFIVALALGLVIAYLWVNYTTLWNPFCVAPK